VVSYTAKGVKIGTDLIDNWLKNLPAQQVSRDGQFAIEESHIRVIRVLYVETGKVEHLFCSPETKHTDRVIQ
jgi:1,6-anhydro-N-acetylmuramate kinase